MFFEALITIEPPFPPLPPQGPPLGRYFARSQEMTPLPPFPDTHLSLVKISKHFFPCPFGMLSMYNYQDPLYIKQHLYRAGEMLSNFLGVLSTG